MVECYNGNSHNPEKSITHQTQTLKVMLKVILPFYLYFVRFQVAHGTHMDYWFARKINLDY